MISVHLVATGCYSDYKVLAAYSSKEAAERAQSLADPCNDVLSLDLDPPTAEWIPAGHLIWSVTAMADDRGHTLRLCDSPLIVRLRGIDEDLFERTCRERISLSVVTKGMLSAPGTRAYHVVVSATDKDHAIKTASELFTQYIARKAGAA